MSKAALKVADVKEFEFPTAFSAKGDNGMSTREFATLLMMHALISRADFDPYSEAAIEKAFDRADDLGELAAHMLMN